MIATAAVRVNTTSNRARQTNLVVLRGHRRLVMRDIFQLNSSRLIVTLAAFPASGEAMKVLIAGITTVAVIVGASPVDAKGFLSGLLRGGVRSAARAGVHAGVQSYAPKTYGPDTMTVEQIEKCLGSAQELDKSSEHVDALTNAVDVESAAIARSQQFLSMEKDLVDRYSEASVNAYNRKLTAMRTRISAYNASVDRAKAEQTSHNARVVSYNAECAKKYYADDMEAARIKLGVKDDAK
jgi:hypothetical protein